MAKILKPKAILYVVIGAWTIYDVIIVACKKNRSIVVDFRYRISSQTVWLSFMLVNRNVESDLKTNT